MIFDEFLRVNFGGKFRLFLFSCEDCEDEEKEKRGRSGSGRSGPIDITAQYRRVWGNV